LASRNAEQLHQKIPYQRHGLPWERQQQQVLRQVRQQSQPELRAVLQAQPHQHHEQLPGRQILPEFRQGQHPEPEQPFQPKQQQEQRLPVLWQQQVRTVRQGRLEPAQKSLPKGQEH
jgi:hypothetical protein